MDEHPSGRAGKLYFLHLIVCPYFYKNYGLKTILNEQQLALTIKRLGHQILENHLDLNNTVLIGMQPRGIYVSDRIVAAIKEEVAPEKVLYGKLDITFY